jgi:3-methyladenine DNA glycosylase AlkD
VIRENITIFNAKNTTLMNATIENLRQELVRNSDEKVRISGERFFKEDVRLYGIKSAEVRRIGREHFRKISDTGKQNIFSLCEELWQSGMMEESFIACNWSYNVRKSFELSDFVTFENWINDYVNNWASCDTFCNHTVGALVEMHPELLSGLKRWATSENRWMKRASAVSLIIPAKQGKFLEDVFEIAGILLSDKDDMVQKGYGWMLKVASQAHRDEVFSYVMGRRAAMPRTALRYAIEKMPADLRKAAMEKIQF